MSNNNGGIYIGLPQFLYSYNFRLGFTALIIAGLIVLSTVSKMSTTTILVIGMLTILIILIMNSSIGVNYEGSLPSTTYPIPSHLGLDGVSSINQQF
jgi:hypothetical protein